MRTRAQYYARSEYHTQRAKVSFDENIRSHSWSVCVFVTFVQAFRSGCGWHGIPVDVARLKRGQFE